MTIGDVVNRIYFLTGTNSSSFAAADMLISINDAVNRVASLILKADDRWQWDDNNQTDLPIATTNLVSGQQDYGFSASFLTIDRVEALDASGNWLPKLLPIDQHDVKYEALRSHLAVSGAPIEYDKIGSSIFLYPVPNYNSTNGLKIYFTRGPLEFTSGDVSTGTKVIGFNSLFHDLIPLWVSYDYAVAKGQQTANGFLSAIQLKEKAIDDFYGQRSHDERPRLKVSTNRSRGGNQSGHLSGGWGDSNE